jgi:DNA sulfur modification protein DndD
MTKVESIVMQNFYNYRDYIQYDFKEGLNVIVADNNGGKSKLYNAFNWILSDRVFDSDTRQYYDVTNSNKVGLFKMISDKAKSVSNVDETINTKVELIFSNFLNPGNPKTYRIVKQIKAVKKIVEAPFDPQSWQIELLPIECFHEDILESKPVAGDSIIGKLFPDALKHYFLFQGEEVDKLIGKELTNAVREIHGTWMYDYMGLFLKDLLEKSENDFRKYNTSFSTNTKKAQNLNNEIDHLKKLIEEKKDDISSHNEKLENLREKLTLSEEEIAEYQKQSSIKSQLASVHAKINESSDRISNFEMKYNEHFFSSKWLLLGFDKYEAKFNQLRKAYKDWKTAEKVKEEIEIFTTDLPFGSPGLPELRLMLEEMKCFVCDRKIDNGSHSYEHIQKLIDHYTPKPKAAEPEDHIEEFFDELFKSFNELPKEREVEQEKRALVSTYEKMNENLKQYSNKARELEQNQKMDFEEFKKKWDDHKYFSSEINNVKNRIEKAKDTIRNAEAECKKKESALSKLSTGTNPGYKISINC